MLLVLGAQGHVVHCMPVGGLGARDLGGVQGLVCEQSSAGFLGSAIGVLLPAGISGHGLGVYAQDLGLG